MEDLDPTATVQYGWFIKGYTMYSTHNLWCWCTVNVTLDTAANGGF